MKKYFTLIYILFIFLLSSFKPASGLDDVINALRNGSANQIGKYITENIELSIFDKSDNYSRAQSLMILKDFFGSNDVTGFEVRNKGENNGNQYCVGILYTRSGNYRTIIFMKTKSNRYQVKEIVFQPF